MSVSTSPMCTATTCVPCAASSSRVLSVSAQAAAFDAAYAPALGAVNQDSAEMTLRIAPPPLAARTGAKARVMSKGP